MEFNRLISLVIGFIVLILVFVWVGSRFRSATKIEAKKNITITLTSTITPTKKIGQAWNPLGFLFKNTPSPSPTKTVVITKITQIPTQTIKTTTQKGDNQKIQTNRNTVIVYKNTKTGETTTTNNNITKGGIKQIPETGAPTLLIPLAFSALTLGAYLRKRV